MTISVFYNRKQARHVGFLNSVAIQGQTTWHQLETAVLYKKGWGLLPASRFPLHSPTTPSWLWRPKHNDTSLSEPIVDGFIKEGNRWVPIDVKYRPARSNSGISDVFKILTSREQLNVLINNDGYFFICTEVARSRKRGRAQFTVSKLKAHLVVDSARRARI